jgi:D-alanyl-D-alanine carboxypeptidase
MPVLRLGASGKLAQLFNEFLQREGFAPNTASVFGGASAAATKQFQQWLIDQDPSSRKGKIQTDGQPGNQTLGFACGVHANDELSPQSIADSIGVNYPQRNAALPRELTETQKRAMFGDLQYRAANNDPKDDAIIITNGWDVANIVSVVIPELAGVEGASKDGHCRVHRAIAEQYLALWAAWSRLGIAKLVTSYGGAFEPRFIRGTGKTRISNHAYGTAFDVNASANWLSHLPAFPGENGSLFAHVEAAQVFGFSWGGFYMNRLDGMHFEAMKVLTAGELAVAKARF